MSKKQSNFRNFSKPTNQDPPFDNSSNQRNWNRIVNSNTEKPIPVSNIFTKTTNNWEQGNEKPNVKINQWNQDLFFPEKIQNSKLILEIKTNAKEEIVKKSKK